MGKPRGIRLNNPGNIRLSNVKWDGRAELQEDPEFVTFTQPQFGIRAIARILISYEAAGIHTVRGVINRWAPPNENDTGAYVLDVAQRIGVDPDAVVDIDSYAVAFELIKAIIKHENGQQPYSDRIIRDSMRLAGIVGTPHKALIEQTGFTTQAIAATASGLGVVASAAAPLKAAADSLEPFGGAPIIGQITTVLLTVAGIASYEALRRG